MPLQAADQIIKTQAWPDIYRPEKLQ